LQNISSSPQQVESVDQLVRNLEDILDEAVSIRIEQEDVENATIQALAFYDLINSILETYGSAYAVDSDMAMMGQSSNNMSTHTFGNNSSIEVNSMNMSSSGTMVGMDAGGRESNINSSLVNMTDYQSAQTLAAKALEIFSVELKPMAPNNSSAFITNLENGLTQLNASIKNKASLMDIMMIVHTQIHSNLLEEYNLRLE
jgi:hypothetical protein